MAREAAQSGHARYLGPVRKFMLCLCPALFAGAVLTGGALARALDGLLPGTWLLLYGCAVLSASTVTIASTMRLICIMGALFVVLGSLAFVLPRAATRRSRRGVRRPAHRLRLSGGRSEPCRIDRLPPSATRRTASGLFRSSRARPAGSTGAVATGAVVPNAAGMNADGGFDRLIYERVRLGIMSALAMNEQLTFNELKSLFNASDGNLGAHARKLEEAGYVACTKSFEARRPKIHLSHHGRRPQGAAPLPRAHRGGDQGHAARLSASDACTSRSSWTATDAGRRSAACRAPPAMSRAPRRCARRSRWRRARGVETLTMYAFSAANWARPATEVAALMRLFGQYLFTETRRCVEQSIRINVIGRRDRLSDSLLRSIEQSERLSAAGAGMHLRIAVDYSSQYSIVKPRGAPPAIRISTSKDFNACCTRSIIARIRPARWIC